jgi:hypothetical protein
MEQDAREVDGTILRETPEEAACAIANALEFLREEAAAFGMRDVCILIGLACARMRDYWPVAVKVQEHH